MSARMCGTVHFLFTLFSATLLLLSCGKSTDEGAGKGDANTPTVRTGGLTADQSPIKCPGSCNSAVVQVTVAHESKSVVCSGVLVAPDVVMTATSCFPPGMQYADVPCANSVEVIFPGASETKLMCETTLEYSKAHSLFDEGELPEPQVNVNNYMYFKLEAAVGVTPLRISKKGISNGEKLVVWGIEHTSTDVIQRRSEVTNIQNSFVNPLAYSPYTPGIFVAGLAPYQGITGAPIVNLDGEVVALVSSGIDQESKSLLIDHGIQEEGSESRFLIGTNMVCLPDSNGKFPTLPADCSDTYTWDYLQSARGLMLADAKERMDPYLVSLLDQQMVYGEWKLVHPLKASFEGQATTGALNCFRVVTENGVSTPVIPDQGRWFIYDRKDPVWTYKLTLNEFGQVELPKTALETYGADVQVRVWKAKRLHRHESLLPHVYYDLPTGVSYSTQKVNRCDRLQLTPSDRVERF